MISCCGGQTFFQALWVVRLSLCAEREVSETGPRSHGFHLQIHRLCSLFPVCRRSGWKKKKKKKLSQISEAWALTVFICFYFIFVGTCPQGNNKGVYLLVRNNPLAWMTIWSTIFSSSKPWSCLSTAAALKQCILSVCYLPDCANCFIRLLSWSAVLQDDHLHSFYGRWEWGLAKLPNVLKVKWLVNLLIPCKHHRAGG